MNHTDTASAPPELTGYSDRWSVAPGERLRFMVSTDAPEYDATLVRLRHGDMRPGTPGLRETALDGVLASRHTGRRQTARAGSCVVVDRRPALADLGGLTVQLWVWPTTPAGPSGSQGLVGAKSAGDGRGWELFLDGAGRLCWSVAGVEGGATITAPAPLRSREWYFICAGFDGAEHSIRLWQRPLRPVPDDATDVRLAAGLRAGALSCPPHGLLLAALRPRSGSGPVRTWADGHFSGKLDSPRLFAGLLADAQVAALHDGRAPADVAGDTLLAAWNFAEEPASDMVVDRGPYGLNGRLVNLPTRAVTGHRWTGRHLHWQQALDEYTAIHFHGDDIDDARWRPDIELTIPGDLRTGVYAVRLRADDVEDHIPFVVRPARDRATATVAVLIPTFTYLAYANERVQFAIDYHDAGIIGHEPVPDPRDLWLRQHPELGMSLYDRHEDDSGVCYSSRLRPIPSFRPDYRNWLTGATRHLAADLYLVDWLDEMGVEYDVITDEDLHADGQALLDRYRVVITGSHPEYYTEAMLDAVEGYVWRAGGRLMYLGGNGFYWVTSVHPDKPHIIEVRRGYSATRGWESLPGETYHATTGEPGGLWRHRGRPPNRLVGVGFTAQGWDAKAPGYRRLPASHDPAVAWIFDGIDADETIGDFGLVMGGAAGDELDRYDSSLGSSPGTIVLATTLGQHSETYHLTVEDVPVIVPHLNGTNNDRVRADMAYTTTPTGGGVFAAASINWLGSLSHNGYCNSVSLITGNVLRRFSADGGEI